MSAFVREDGTTLDFFEVREDLNQTLKELRRLTALAEEFRAQLDAGTLPEDSAYLSFGIVMEDGGQYDRTGPSYVTKEEE